MGPWGHTNAADEAKLDAAAKAFAAKVKALARVRTAQGCETLVRAFVRAYLRIGDDPTDTVIRDNVWEFLLKRTKGRIPVARLDAVWQEEVDGARRRTACVVS